MTWLENETVNRAYRVFLAIFGGYAFSAGFFAFLSVSFAHLGTTRAEAMLWGVLTCFLVYVAVVIWAVATPHLLRTTLFITICSAAMILTSPPLAALLG